MPTLKDIQYTAKLLWSHPLNSGMRMQAFMRYARWQFGSRMLPGAMVCNWINGTRFICRPGETGLTGNMRNHIPSSF